MKTPKVLVLRAAGINCDQETKYVFEKAGAEADLVHINRLYKNRSMLSDYHIFVIPGGFSHGDDISAGKILANELRFNLGRELDAFINDKKLMLGICNGFQVLVKTGFLPGFPPEKGSAGHQQLVTLISNDSNRYEDRWVYLKLSSKKSEFIKGDSILYLPVAHGEGKFVPKDKSVLAKLKKFDQIVFKYVKPDGKPSAVFPYNPNGSVEGIAGICDYTGRILGMMPHPERYSDAANHPRWTRDGLKKTPDGMRIFTNAVNYVKENLL